VPVHELLDKIINYPALAFQHGQNPGPEDLLKLLVGFGEHIKGPTGSKETVCRNCMKMRVKPGVISKGMNEHHKAWNSVRKAKHSTKENLKTFPCTMAELCQKLPVVFEIDPEKNGYAEYKLPVRYWIEDIVAYIFSELDHLFGMAAWAEPPAFAAKCQEILIAAIGIRVPDPDEAFLQAPAFQVVIYYPLRNGLVTATSRKKLYSLIALVIVCLEFFVVIVQNVP